MSIRLLLYEILEAAFIKEADVVFKTLQLPENSLFILIKLHEMCWFIIINTNE